MENPEVAFDLYLFTKGDPYKMLGIDSLGPAPVWCQPGRSPDGYLFLVGTDSQGRDYYSLIVYGGRLSLMVGLIGQILTLSWAVSWVRISGFYGGTPDVVIQRLTEYLAAFPDIPLFMALAAAIPKYWSPIMVYFMLTLDPGLRAMGWPGAPGARDDSFPT